MIRYTMVRWAGNVPSDTPKHRDKAKRTRSAAGRIGPAPDFSLPALPAIAESCWGKRVSNVPRITYDVTVYEHGFIETKIKGLTPAMFYSVMNVWEPLGLSLYIHQNRYYTCFKCLRELSHMRMDWNMWCGNKICDDCRIKLFGEDDAE